MSDGHKKFLVRYTELKRWPRRDQYQPTSEKILRVYPNDPYSIMLQIRTPQGYAGAVLEPAHVDELIAALNAAIETRRPFAKVGEV